jgi:uncharacterized protein YdhG (YjbR/CyaY superfamily)
MQAKSKGRAKPETIDGYLAKLSSDKRAALERLRRSIHAAVPGLEECISYQIPAFRHDGRVLAWFGAGAKHCAFYPGAVVEAHKKELEGYDISKGTIRFQPDDPLPAALVRKLLKARVEANRARDRRKSAGAARRRLATR